MLQKTLRESKAFILRCSVNTTHAARENSASTHQICMSFDTEFVKMLISVFQRLFCGQLF